MGFADEAAFSIALKRHRSAVSRQFDSIFAASDTTEHQLSALWHEPYSEGSSTTDELSALGYTRAPELHRRLSLFRHGNRYRQMPADSQRRLDRLVPAAIAAAATHGNPDATLERLLELFEGISRREAYLALLHEYPHALDRVTNLMSTSPWVAQYITQHPILLDDLLDARSLLAAPDWDALRAELRGNLAAATDDIEQQMDMLRHFKNTQTLHCIAQDIAGTLPLEALSDQLSEVACVILEEVLRLSWQGLTAAPSGYAVLRHRRLRQAGRQGAGLCLRPRHRIRL